MMQHVWSGGGVYTVCVDSYEQSVLKGRIFCPHYETVFFSSLSQFLLKMEELLDHIQIPQAFSEPRKFALLLHPEILSPASSSRINPGITFELKILFRQHTSWQGILVWKEKQIAHNFRSVLELVILMDSALRSMERSGCA